MVRMLYRVQSALGLVNPEELDGCASTSTSESRLREANKPPLGDHAGGENVDDACSSGGRL